jgi:hypothetical protein
MLKYKPAGRTIINRLQTDRINMQNRLITAIKSYGDYSTTDISSQGICPKRES